PRAGPGDRGGPDRGPPHPAGADRGARRGAALPGLGAKVGGGRGRREGAGRPVLRVGRDRGLPPADRPHRLASRPGAAAAGRPPRPLHQSHPPRSDPRGTRPRALPPVAHASPLKSATVQGASRGGLALTVASVLPPKKEGEKDPAPKPAA